jgi:hypothetical protein
MLSNTVGDRIAGVVNVDSDGLVGVADIVIEACVAGPQESAI